MMRRDTRGDGPAQSRQAKPESAGPGKRTLVEGVLGDRQGADEAAKGGADVKTRGAPDNPAPTLPEPEMRHAEPGQSPASASAGASQLGASKASPEPSHAPADATSSHPENTQPGHATEPTTPVVKQERAQPSRTMMGRAMREGQFKSIIDPLSPKTSLFNFRGRLSTRFAKKVLNIGS